jgi:NADH-quinone oxidoreductase subunit C
MSETIEITLDELIPSLEKAKSEGFSILLDICCNMLGKSFHIDYRLREPQSNHSVLIRLIIKNDEIVPSVAKIFLNAELLECEVFEMFGVSFAMHPHLRKIYTDDQISGHPLRKDYFIETDDNHTEIG